jgi:hypothetical protein
MGWVHLIQFLCLSLLNAEKKLEESLLLSYSGWDCELEDVFGKYGDCLNDDDW